MIDLITHFVIQCGTTIFTFIIFIIIFIGTGGGTVWPLNWKYGESLTLTVFSLTHKRKGPRVSDSLKKILNGVAASNQQNQQTWSPLWPTETPTTETTIVRCHKNSWIYLTSTYYWWLLRPTITIRFDSKFQIIAQLFDSIWNEMKINTIRTALVCT